LLIKKGTEGKGNRKTRNKLCTRLKPLACAFVRAGYNRERSKEAADILPRYVQGDATAGIQIVFFVSSQMRFTFEKFCFTTRLRYFVSKVRTPGKKDDHSCLPRISPSKDPNTSGDDLRHPVREEATKI